MAANELAGDLKVEPLRLVEPEIVSCHCLWLVGIHVSFLWQSKTVVAVIGLVFSKRLLQMVL